MLILLSNETPSSCHRLWLKSLLILYLVTHCQRKEQDLLPTPVRVHPERSSDLSLWFRGAPHCILRSFRQHFIHKVRASIHNTESDEAEVSKVKVSYLWRSLRCAGIVSVASECEYSTVKHSHSFAHSLGPVFLVGLNFVFSINSLALLKAAEKFVKCVV